MTSSNEAISALLAFVWGIHWSPVSSHHKGQWYVALMFSLMRAWTNGWVNNRDTGNLTRHHAHYVVTVTIFLFLPACRRQQDVVFMLDFSGSVEAQYANMINFVKQTVLGLDMTFDRTRFAVLTFGGDVTIQFDLNAYRWAKKEHNDTINNSNSWLKYVRIPHVKFEIRPNKIWMKRSTYGQNCYDDNPANTQSNKHVIITSKRRFDVIITCLLRCVFAGNSRLTGNHTMMQSLQWRHNGHDSVSNHQPYDCLLNCLFRRRSKKTSKLRVTGPLSGEFTGDRWIPRTNGQ